MLTNSQPRVAVHRLNNLRAFVINDPIRIDLTVAVRIENHSLVLSEVGAHDLGILRTNVVFVFHTVVVDVAFASVADSII
jgi:hypothetical protein